MITSWKWNAVDPCIAEIVLLRAERTKGGRYLANNINGTGCRHSLS